MIVSRTSRALVVLLPATGLAVVSWLVLGGSESRSLARTSAGAPPEDTVAVPGSEPSLLPDHEEHTEWDSPGPTAPSESPSEPPSPSSPGPLLTFPEARLHAVADSFSTGSPDVGGLIEIVELLATSMELVPDSLTVDEATGAFSGKLQLGGLTGSFSARPGGSCAIELLGPDRSGSSRRQMTIELTERDGAFDAGDFALQSFPEKQPGSTGQVGLRTTGWRTHIDAMDRAQGYLRTTDVQEHPRSRGYLFETSEAAEAVEFEPVSGANAFELWRARLREFKRH